MCLVVVVFCCLIGRTVLVFLLQRVFGAVDNGCCRRGLVQPQKNAKERGWTSENEMSQK